MDSFFEQIVKKKKGISEWAVIFVTLVLSLIVFGIMKWTNPLYKRIQSRLDQVTGAARENFSGVRVIQWMFLFLRTQVSCRLP